MVPGPGHRVHFLLLLLLAAAISLRAAGPHADRPAMPETLDHKTLHGQYNEGDFESVIAGLETFMRRNRTYSHEDSVFIAKHLAVVYSANPATREKGKYYMHRLLELLPSAKLVDMYVSEEIDRIFEKVREEFLSRQRAFGVEAERTALPRKAPVREEPPPPRPARPEKPEKPEKGTAGFWIAGGTVVVLAGATAAYLVHQNEKGSSAPHWLVSDAEAGR